MRKTYPTELPYLQLVGAAEDSAEVSFALVSSVDDMVMSVSQSGFLVAL